MGKVAYKKMIEQRFGTNFKDSEQVGFKYLGLNKNLQEYEGSEYDGQFKATIFIMFQNSDRQYRMYVKNFKPGVMTNQTYKGKGYKDLYEQLIAIVGAKNK